MKQLFYLSAFCVLSLAACTGAFKKGDKGIEYKIISIGKGKTIGYGNFLQLHVSQVYAGTKDSLLQDSRDYMPSIQVFDSISTPLAYYKIIKQLKKGDSLIIRVLTDSIYKDQRQEMPPFMKKGKYIYTHVKLLNVFETPQEADSANNAERIIARPRIFKKQMEEIEKDIAGKKEQLAKDSKIIEDYLAKNNIKAEKTKWGTYIAISNEGTGDKLGYTDIAAVNYTGRTLDSGRVFDTNTDPKIKDAAPYNVEISKLGAVIFGWSDALMHLRKGSKATIYVPSSLGYGASGNGPKIGPNQNLVFDMEIADVFNEEQYAAKQKAMQEEMMKKMQEGQNQAPQGTTKPGNK